MALSETERIISTNDLSSERQKRRFDERVSFRLKVAENDSRDFVKRNKLSGNNPLLSADSLYSRLFSLRLQDRMLRTQLAPTWFDGLMRRFGSGQTQDERQIEVYAALSRVRSEVSSVVDGLSTDDDKIRARKAVGVIDGALSQVKGYDSAEKLNSNEALKFSKLNSSLQQL